MNADHALTLSIVTPSYAQVEFLARTIDSVLAQTDAQVQYIVVDGASKDGSVEVLNRYRDRLDHLVIEPDDGQADALRKGFEYATGDICAYLNSDDLLLPGTARFVLEYFRNHPEVDAIYSNRIFIDDQDRIAKFWILPPHNSYCMSRWDFIPQECCFWRRSLMQRVGSIDRTFQFALDYDLFARMMRVGRFRRVRRFLAAFRVHPAAKSSRLYESVGRPEIERVRRANGIQIHWYDQILKYVFGGSILGVSLLFKLMAIHEVRRRIRLRTET